MRAGLTLLPMLLLVLAGCQMTGGQAEQPQVLTGDEIAVTSLDGPGLAAEAGESGLPDMTLPDPGLPDPAMPEAGTADPGAAEPDLQTAPEELLCRASGGLWTVAGDSGAFLCVKPTRDGGKACRKESDCDGQCLARSGSCAPYAPLYGCNEVLDRQGRRVTLCLG